jgi:hypothetical protein
MVFTGATNAAVVGAHTLRVWTSKDSAGSANYRLVPRGGAISGLSVSVTPNIAGAAGTTYTVGFNTSATGALVAGAGTITVTAAPGTKLPNCALVTDLTTNNTDVAGLHTLRVSTSTDAGGGARYDLVAPRHG